MLALPDLRVIDFVRYHDEVVLDGHGGDGFKRVAAVDCARGVVGRVDEQGFGPHGGGIERLKRGQEPVVCLGYYRFWHTADGADRAGVGGIVGVDVERCVAFIEGRTEGGEERGLPACCDQHIVERGGDACARREPRRHSVAQIINAWNHGIACGAAQCGGMHRLKDACVCPDVVLADGELGDIMALRDHLAGFDKEVPAVRAAACDGCDGVGQTHRGLAAVWVSLKWAHGPCLGGQCQLAVRFFLAGAREWAIAWLMRTMICIICCIITC